jgi:two-component system, chemotaxis family, protein-glutamate methylesterase/glutaminase
MLSEDSKVVSTPVGVDIDAIVIGASAGAIEALGTLLPLLPAELSVPIVVVVHIPPNRPSLLAELFSAKCQLPVREVEDKADVRGGTIWFAPPGYHVLVERDRTFALSVDEPVNFSRPSIDVLFESAAEVYTNRLLALVLTGANQDGAAGSACVRDAGGLVAVQDPETATASAMPSLAIARGTPDLVGSLAELATFACHCALGGPS